MISVSVLYYLLILLVSGFIGGILLKSIKQPPVIGYLLSGLAINLLFGNFIRSDTLEFLAELGVILLLFTLGLEFSLGRLKKVAHIAVFGAIVQIIVTLFIASALLSQFGFSLFESIFMAAAFSLSSTAVVVSILSYQGELDTLAGDILVGWLIIQDLAVLPMIILLPTFGRELFSGNFTGQSLINISANIAFAVSLLAVVMIASKQLVPAVLNKIASVNSRELLLVAAVGVAVASGLLTQLLGLSAALGAFLAGVLIAESTQTHAIFSEIRPLRDIFGMIFFTSLGLVIPQGFIFSNLGLILVLTIAIMLIKFAVVPPLVLALGHHPKTSLTIGVALVEVGEFAFVLGRTGLGSGVISREVYAMIISVALTSILFFPPFYFATPTIYTKLRDLIKIHLPPLYFRFFTQLKHKDTLSQLPYSNHVVLCGYGRVGKYIGRALQLSGISFIVVEYDYHKTSYLRQKGIEVVYGDPADIDILDFAQVDKARAVVVTIPDFYTSQMVVTNSLTLNKDVKIFCRSHHESELKALYALGVTAVIQPEFEASLSITSKILKLFGTAASEVEGKITRLKIEHGLG